MQSLQNTVNISKLKGWDKNPRGIKKDAFERLKRQITAHGQFKPVLATPEGEVIGGNMRLKAYQDLGITEVWVSIVEPKDETEKVAIALADNDRAGYYEEDALAELISSVPDLVLEDYHLDLGKTLSAKDLLDKFRPTEEDDFDVEEALPDDPISRLGDIYQLGSHRLMCGDSTDLDTVTVLLEGKQADLVFTDPPYGINVVEKDGKVGGGELAKNKVYTSVIGDENTETANSFYSTCVSIGLDKYIIWGGNYFLDFLPFSSSLIVWDKRGDMPSNDFADGEIAWTNIPTRVRIYKQIWNGMIREGESEVRVHPTQKPIRVLGDIVKDFTKEGQKIYDGFGGSGSTLIACEQLERNCYMMELDPRYCDVIIKRWEQFTGKKAINLTGKNQE